MTYTDTQGAAMLHRYLLLLLTCITSTAVAVEPIPDKLVVLTFDDSAKSHFTIVRPVLKKYRFGATFFITEGFDFRENKRDYMTWDEIAQLHKDGFEIGNHTRDHLGINAKNLDRVAEQLNAINERCREHKIPKTTSFAWPGNSTDAGAFELLKKAGIQFARRGGAPEHPYETGAGFAYQPGLDHPLLIPSAGDARPKWELEDFITAANKARHGRIAVLQFHGAPDTAHSWVSTSKAKFESYMKYLAINNFTVISMRDLGRYVDFRIEPKDAQGVIQDRQQSIREKRDDTNFRKPKTAAEQKQWLTNMVVFHRYSPAEIGAATGMSAEAIANAIETFGISKMTPPKHSKDSPIVVLPFPGGRHPRIGFLDGAIRPQRETKVSIFTPWKKGGYVVADVPEAIWHQRKDGNELLYLAHTHIPTRWTKQGVDLQPLEWKRESDGVLASQRELPNGVEFGCKVRPHAAGANMEMWIKNGSDEMLSGLRVQNCVMLKSAVGFNDQSNENKVVRGSFIACHNQKKTRWIITSWRRSVRAWSNAACPCMHSDPQFADCDPGETQRITGGVWFYEGADIQSELARLEKTDW